LRPRKEGMDYFPVDVDLFEDDKLFDVQNEFGPLGEVIYIRLLCLIYKNGYYYKFESLDKLSAMLIKSIGNRWIRDRQTVKEVIPFLAKCNLFSPELMRENVLTSQSIQRRYQKATERRQSTNSKEYWLLEETSIPLINAPENPVNVDNNLVNVCNNSVNVSNNTQSIEKQSIENKNKEEEMLINNARTKMDEWITANMPLVSLDNLKACNKASYKELDGLYEVLSVIKELAEQGTDVANYDNRYINEITEKLYVADVEKRQYERKKLHDERKYLLTIINATKAK